MTFSKADCYARDNKQPCSDAGLFCVWLKETGCLSCRLREQALSHRCGSELARECAASVQGQNRSIGADSSAGSGLPGAVLPPPISFTLGGVSSLLNSSKNAFGVLGVAARPLIGSTLRLRMPSGSACTWGGLPLRAALM